MSIIGISTTETIHRASQYLTAAAISCLDQKDDDSHTNLGWNAGRMSFTTRYLNDNELYLSLSLKNSRLEFIRKDTVLASKPLAGSEHIEIVKWLSEVFRDLKLNAPYKYNFHYELPYPEITNDYIFEIVDEEDILVQAEMRHQSYKVLKELTENLGMDAEIRTWPHHFDTGTLINMGNNSSIGIGLAIPDSMVNDYYYYVSGWKGNEMKAVSGMPSLKYGEWIDEDWKGAILKSSSLRDETLIHFLSEAVDYYKTT